VRKYLPLLITYLFLQPFNANASSFAEHMHVYAPPEALPSFVYEDASGGQHALSDLKGRYVLLNVWATWCAPCVREMPSLEALQKNFDPKKLIIIPLSEDRGDSVVQSFYTKHTITALPIAIDQAGTAPASFHIDGLPTTLLIDPQGRVISRFEGDADWSTPDVVDYLRTRTK
jgi:thiol-disulfide isomerase/thioredoxin